MVPYGIYNGVNATRMDLFGSIMPYRIQKYVNSTSNGVKDYCNPVAECGYKETLMESMPVIWVSSAIQNRVKSTNVVPKTTANLSQNGTIWNL